MVFSRPLAVHATAIPGLLLLDLPVHGDTRGWFKENWQRQKMTALGLPDFAPVQNNVSFNAAAGTTRGIHAEPWDKYVSVATGRIFGAWVDLRPGPTFGAVATAELDPSRAVFVPRGVGNAFQTLQDGTAYTYLVNDHWSAEAQGEYTFLNLADETVAIPWPIPLEHAELSEKDRAHPRLADVEPMRPRTVLVLGAGGQLGRALREAYDGAPPGAVEFATRADFDLAAPASFASRDWSQYSTIINAAAYTAVDAAEAPEGRRAAWAVNAGAVARLARVAAEHRITLVNVSSDYVFDGTVRVHQEDEPFSPLGVYGQSKAAGDAAVAAVPRHYTVRTSWVIGDGNNFVRTMARLASEGVSPAVVDDQMGRPTFTADLAAGIRHLLETGAPYGTYNLSSSGEVASWADVAAEVFAVAGRHPGDIQRTTTAAYFADRPHTAPRPLNSTLDLHRIESTGFTPHRWEDRLRTYPIGP
ncbi:bifunctional dTDP-4-dehydrorhamnose 3,5-epimerase family protein/NAD(P)-dependent oxidoreductase [Sinomonas flava]|uniref:bifunctional dTDP-4-dehydrorhamnose 3,5-epimerase family protein/NAD(P)-dependent oxidoreductase n=1 Tax=Sinomonas flava TaxID=496857 RepID=UPI0031D30A65